MRVTEVYTPNRDGSRDVDVWEMAWHERLRELVGHWLLCEVLERHLPKRVGDWRPGPRFKFFRNGLEGAPLYVWFDLHCPQQNGKFRFRHRKPVYSGTVDVPKVTRFKPDTPPPSERRPTRRILER